MSELRILSEVERTKANLAEIEEEACQIHLRDIELQKKGALKVGEKSEESAAEQAQKAEALV